MSTYVKISDTEGGTSFGTIDGVSIADIVLDGNTFDNIIFKNNNTVSVLKETFEISGTSATCTANGTRIGTSKYDGHTESKTLPALGHYNGTTYTQPYASNGCNSSGWTTIWCGRCGTQLSRTVAWSVGHTGTHNTKSAGYWATNGAGNCTPAYYSWWSCCNSGNTWW